MGQRLEDGMLSLSRSRLDIGNSVFDKYLNGLKIINRSFYTKVFDHAKEIPVQRTTAAQVHGAPSIIRI
ncbi:unnamed protein product [Hermetia illucens]|uniref:Uncharacterized protein n=1 Tax=Hermetia illucens TaxID=343691 RepID=A0A7R8V1Z4_HERIL|nr:unnamed protein product [Hermetia illucens]